MQTVVVKVKTGHTLAQQEEGIGKNNTFKEKQRSKEPR